jgi:hypothetical protein
MARNQPQSQTYDLVLCQHKEQGLLVIPAQAGIQWRNLDSRLRGNDETPKSRFDKALVHYQELNQR